MLKSSLLVLILTLLMVPALAFADADVRQDSCIAFEDAGKSFVRVHFSVINFSLPTAICDLHLTPEPLPVLPECEMLACGAPAADPAVVGSAGWSCALKADGGADWFANAPADCIAPGTLKGGFDFLLDPGFCCYLAEYTDATGAVILEEEVCFCDGTVGVEKDTWGGIKIHYREEE